MNHLKTSRHLQQAIELAYKEQWEGPIPNLDGVSVKIGILVWLLARNNPQILESGPVELVDLIYNSNSKLAQKFADFDLRTVAFVIRMQRSIAKSRVQSAD